MTREAEKAAREKAQFLKAAAIAGIEVCSGFRREQTAT